MIRLLRRGREPPSPAPIRSDTPGSVRPAPNRPPPPDHHTPLEDALAFHQRALAMDERLVGPDHRNIAGGVHNVAIVLKALGRFEEARGHYMHIYERDIGYKDIRRRLEGLDPS